MKRLIKLNVFLAAVVITAMAMFTACEGPAGATGDDVEDGEDGTDASATCTDCHNSSSSLLAKELQLNNSLHRTGDTWEEGTRNSCAPCHSNEGFLDVIANDPPKNKYVASDDALTDPTPIGCRTCHKIHTNYDSTDYDFTTVAAIDMLIDTTQTLMLDLGGSSNLCAKCHQPRIVKQMDFEGAPTTAYTGITSFRYGTHYGTQGAILGGKGGKEFTGTETYSNSSHTTVASCASCHAATTSGTSGGHSFNVVDEESGDLNTNGCVTCHTTGTSDLNTKIDDAKTVIDDLTNQLGDKIGFMQKDENGEYTGYVDIYDPSSNPEGKYKYPGSTSSWTQEQKDYNNSLTSLPTIDNRLAAAVVNFQLAVRDRSHGVHNYAYTKALLTNTYAALP